MQTVIHRTCASMEIKICLNLGMMNVYLQVLSFFYFRRYLGAWPAFVLSLFYIGCLTAVVEQVGSLHTLVNESRHVISINMVF